jgi:hypothetical protein
MIGQFFQMDYEVKNNKEITCTFVGKVFEIKFGFSEVFVNQGILFLKWLENNCE